jgi:hypothetical protein
MKISEMIRSGKVHRGKKHRTLEANKANLTAYPDNPGQGGLLTMYGIKVSSDEDKKDMAAVIKALKGRKITEATFNNTMLDIRFK